MWRLKSCPRCGGDLFTDNREEYVLTKEVCFQCGYRDYLAKPIYKTRRTDGPRKIAGVSSCGR